MDDYVESAELKRYEDTRAALWEKKDGTTIAIGKMTVKSRSISAR